MKILVISDIHANLTALEAVIEDAGDIAATWCLGDVVGYGPDPNECVQRIRGLPNSICLLGNHDAAALDELDIDSFNPDARKAVLWTQKTLSSENKAFLQERPKKVTVDNVTLAHGSPRHPVWEYLLDTRTATQNFSHFETPYCFVGHSHLPVIYHLRDGNDSANLLIPETQQSLDLTPRAILNPGSVGQPRDRDPRASYAVFDTDELVWEQRRVKYDVVSVQERMETAELPERHIRRLAAGW